MEIVNQVSDYGKPQCTDRNTCIEDLKRSYTFPGHPIAYSGAQTVYKYYRPFLSIGDISNILSELESVTLHKEFHKQTRNPSYSHFPRYQFQIDLVDIQSLADYNNGVRYLLTCIDTYTRYAFARPLATKESSAVLDAFKSILYEAGKKPFMLVSDAGSEFLNRSFKAYCELHGISMFPSNTSTHCAFIERFNRTLQSIIYRYMTENETRRYISVVNKKTGEETFLLPLFLKTYNNRIHRMIGTTPHIAETDPNSHIQISKNLAKYYDKIKPRKAKFEIGDVVRIRHLEGKFDRGYNERAKVEMFKIKEIRTNLKQPLYVLTDYSGNETIKGSFYQHELVKVTGENFRVEKVIKKRKHRGKEQLFVKWKGFNDSYNSWIDSSQVTKVY